MAAIGATLSLKDWARSWPKIHASISNLQQFQQLDKSFMQMINTLKKESV